VNPVTPATYGDVFDLFARYNVSYVVISGMAVVLHGHVRPLFDLDIVVSSIPDEQNRALQALMMAGFVSTIPVPLSIAPVVRMFDQAEREVDVFSRYHIPFVELWNESVPVAIGDSEARVVSFEHLVRAKRITGRPHDLEDVAGLLGLTGNEKTVTEERT
jgi:hypothetical protein